MPEFAKGGLIEALSPNAQDFIRMISDLPCPGQLMNAAAAKAIDSPLLAELNRDESAE
ncbi:hypothetical protein [Nocardia wallacei]|uniref:hypothetical protein n=1 Tax=Nocardia wallacei TaxID=480035 RepID=UPI0024542069|nr:hypothetical protein [Nocardia wallacei]